MQKKHISTKHNKLNMTNLFNKKSQIKKRKLLRKNATFPEQILWQEIRNRKINSLKFKRQFSIGRYVVDFYSPEIRLVIEIDGGYHIKEEVKKYDLDRQKSLELLGLRCLRFTNKEIKENISHVLEKITSFTLSLRRRGSRSGEG